MTRHFKVDTDAEGFAPPPLDPILNYKGVWLLCSVNKFGDLLKGRYYCSCLISGSTPLWGLWTVGGRFVRFYGGRKEIASDYSQLVWRRKMAKFTLESLKEHTLAERRYEISRVTRAKLPVNSGDSAMAQLKAGTDPDKVTAHRQQKRAK